jgi:hypothetical protein
MYSVSASDSAPCESKHGESARGESVCPHGSSVVTVGCKLPMRNLHVRLGDQLQRKLETTGKAKKRLAEEIGISPQKLQAILDDNWGYITRDSIERVADYLGIEHGQEAFEFVPSTFWQSVERSGQCAFVLKTRPRNEVFRIPGCDNDAIKTIRTFLEYRHKLDCPFRDDWQTAEQLLNISRSSNCIVIGSPKSNPATEILLSEFFAARPFSDQIEERRKFPFWFQWPEKFHHGVQSSLLPPNLNAEEREKGGIVLKKGRFLVEYHADFNNWETDTGCDYGVVFVADHPANEKTQFKLIVVAGMSGMGTVAAAQALVRDFRDLEPVRRQRCAFGVVRARYVKHKHASDGRTFQTFRWVYREGGRDPIALKR